MISHGVEISIAGGGADEKDESYRTLPPSYVKYHESSAIIVGKVNTYD